MKVALIHDYLTYFGGAEQVLKSLHSLFPKAPIYTLLYDKKKMGQFFPKAEIKTSFLQKFPKLLRRNKRWLLPFLTVAPETFDLRDFDLVISSCSCFAKGIIIRPKAIHICYCHTPARFIWDWHQNYLKEQKVKRPFRFWVNLITNYLRIWDKTAALRVDYFIANSKTTKARIKKYYQRDSTVIYPPVDVNGVQGSKFPEAEQVRYGAGKVQGSDYFLIVSRLSPYKNVELAVEAFNKLELPLVIIGQGPQLRLLKKKAKKNVKLLGFQPEEVVHQYYQNCRALIFPGEDDFGITPVEAMSYGKPVLALKKGGVTETVIEGVTGEFFDDPHSVVLADGVRRLRENMKNYDSETIKEHAQKYSRERFERETKEFIDKIIQ